MHGIDLVNKEQIIDHQNRSNKENVHYNKKSPLGEQEHLLHWFSPYLCYCYKVAGHVFFCFGNCYTLILVGGNYKRPKSKFAAWGIGVVFRGSK